MEVGDYFPLGMDVPRNNYVERYNTNPQILTLYGLSKLWLIAEILRRVYSTWSNLETGKA